MSMNELIREAAGRRDPQPRDEDADPFAREAERFGIAPDLLDVAKRLLPDELQGAALTSAMRKLVQERPGLVSAEFRAASVDGGANRGGPRREPERSENEIMNQKIRAAAGRGPQPTARGTNGLQIDLARVTIPPLH